MQVFLIIKDFGAAVVSSFILFHEEKVVGFVTIGVLFAVGSPLKNHNHSLRASMFIDGEYATDFSVCFLKKSQFLEIMDMVDSSTPLPPWFTEQDLQTYCVLYEKSGFRTALKVPYRSYGEQTNKLPVNPKVHVPALLIMGEKDYVLKAPGMEEYIRSEKVKDFVPNLEIVFIHVGTHFVQEQFPEEVNQLVLSFLKSHSQP
ncbi:hypothetical protein A4A49_53567 [Nicotiana attenuata]|uniref:Bifunctional epoxide hydrolase 2 n=1 Tax=Nicotiana attenuata TaxID=49451 RepID=A0A1J6K9W2_NICAT|nr:hypothetical protein A4A49_62689 [Nicotiana attenuata]OIT18815.1 hypothetical protein A4A49_53567 [Nicotiana attenuata]